jgi:hypothetical protein
VSTRPFVTARAASELLGVPEAEVIDDVQEGMDGALPALNGGRYGDAWVVYQYEIEGERLAMHQTRFARNAFRETVAP